MSSTSAYRSRESREMDLRVADRSSVLRANLSREVKVEEVIEAESSRKSLRGKTHRGGVDSFMRKQLLLFSMS